MKKDDNHSYWTASGPIILYVHSPFGQMDLLKASNRMHIFTGQTLDESEVK